MVDIFALFLGNLKEREKKRKEKGGKKTLLENGWTSLHWELEEGRNFSQKNISFLRENGNVTKADTNKNVQLTIQFPS